MARSPANGRRERNADEGKGGGAGLAYPPGEGRLPVSMMAGDLKGVRTSVVKDRGGLLDGDHHWV